MSQKSPSNLVRTIKLFILIVVVAAASAGATLLFQEYAGFGPANATHSTPDPARARAPSREPIYLPLEPFTVALTDDYRIRMLYVAITLRLSDTESANLIDAYMPEVRDRTLRLLSLQNAHDIQTLEGRRTLVDALRQELASSYSPEQQGPRIDNVLFTAFVVQ